MPTGVYVRTEWHRKRCHFFQKGDPAPKTAFKKGYIPWIKGKHHSEEAKHKLSLACKGRKLSKEHIEKITKANKGLNMGSKNGMWKGGKIKSSGYIKVLQPSHPFADVSGYVMEHRLAIEEYFRINSPNHPALIEIKGIKYLNPEWIIHHNGTRFPISSIENRQDNRINNFLLFQDKGSHARFHFEYRKGGV